MALRLHSWAKSASSAATASNNNNNNYYNNNNNNNNNNKARSANVSLIVHATQPAQDDAVHTLKASHVTQIFDYVDRALQLAPSSYELLCGGLLLRRDPLAKLPVPYPGANVRIELIRYQDPSVLASPEPASDDDDDNDETFARFIDSSSPTNIPHDHGHTNEQEDERAHFSAAHADPSSLTDKEHMLLMLVEMFEDLPTDILVHATLTSESLKDAIEAALTLQALAAADADVQSSTSSGSGSAAAHSSTSSVDADVFAKYLTEPPAAPPFTPAPSSSTGKRKKKKSSATVDANALGPPGVSTLHSPAMHMLLDMFPKHHASQLDVALHLHNNNVEPAAAYLLGVPAHAAFKCDGGCGELGFPCLVHGTAFRNVEERSGGEEVKTWKANEEQEVDDAVKVLMEVFADRAMWEVKKVLDKVGGDVEKASRVLAGDKVDAEEKPVKPAAARPNDQSKSRPPPPSPLPKPATAHDNPFAVLLDSKSRAHGAASSSSSSSNQFTRVTHKRKPLSTQPQPPTFKLSKRDHRTPAAQAADHLVLPSLPNPSYSTPTSTDDLYMHRAHRFAMARAALRRHAHLGGQVAGALADAGHEITAEIRARELKEAWAKVDAQLTSHHAKWVVDLHGLNVEQAKGVVPEVVRRWWAAGCVRDDGLDVTARRVLTLVVGVGNHSKAGQVRLGPAVVRVVKGMGGRVVDESKARGQVMVVGLAEGAVVS